MAKLMVIDDSSFMRDLLVGIIEDKHTVTAASSGTELFDNYEKEKPDVIFLDLVMPEMNGMDVLSKFMNKYPDAKVIICSSMGGQEEVVKEAISLGAKAVIGKPFSVASVKEAIDSVLA